MKKTLFVLASLFICSVFAFSQELKGSIDADFLSGNEQSTYTEWTGGYSPSEINTAVQIRDIGRRLANGIKYQETMQQDEHPFNKGNPAYKYSAARVYSGSKRGADVILIGETATVDTIKCLKMILQGYVENAYGYSPAEAEKLAQAICNWNTALYKDKSILDDFEDEVKTVFAGYSNKAGLSTSYRDWKKSILVIPHMYTKVQIEEAEPEPELPVYEPEEPVEPVEEYKEPEKPSTTDYGYGSSNKSNSGKNSYSVNNQKKKKNNNLMIIAGACGGAVVIALIVIILALRKRDE